MSRSPSRRRVAVVLLAMGVGALGCATPPAPTLPPPPPPPPELDVARVCAIVVDAEDAAARGALVAWRHGVERDAATDRHAAFAVALAEATPEAAFRAFHDERTAKPASPVGVLGECLVYAGWSRMGQQATQACADAVGPLEASAVLAEIGRSRAALVHDTDPQRALELADAGLAKAPGCAALIVARARARAALQSPRAAWLDAVATLPGCFRCLVEAAAATEREDASPTGRAEAAALWERALAIAPEHADTLRRFAAVTAGVDDARALKAYVAAVRAGARDYPTLLAAARLATAGARTDDEIALAVDFARRASDAAREDPEPRRLLLQLWSTKAAWDEVIVAGNALLDLEPDDAVAHLALARASLAKGRVAAAVRHYDDASAQASSLEPTVAAALTSEHKALLDRLLVDPTKATSGSANAVANATQKQLQNLWRDRLKKKAVTRGGDLTVVAETDATGRVVDVDVKTDTVNDPDLAAAAVAWLSRATVNGGARRYTMEFAVR